MCNRQQMSKFVEQIADYILEDNFFKNYKFRKKDCCLIKKSSERVLKVQLRNWVSENNTLIILPVYSVRFNVLHKWFEKFSKKALSDQRDNSTIGFEGEMLGKTNQYELATDQGFQSVVEDLKLDIISNSNLVFDKYRDLNDIYINKIRPMSDNQEPFPDVGADWAFRFLAITKITNPESYHTVKAQILEHVKAMHEKGEPNIGLYYESLAPIIKDLEHEF